jgi:hypothetical protein
VQFATQRNGKQVVIKDVVGSSMGWTGNTGLDSRYDDGPSGLIDAYLDKTSRSPKILKMRQGKKPESEPEVPLEDRM